MYVVGTVHHSENVHCSYKFTVFIKKYIYIFKIDYELIIYNFKCFILMYCNTYNIRKD